MTPSGVSWPTVSVVIPNWNGAALLPGCLRALRRSNVVDLDVIVVDNGSTDGSVALVTREYPEVRLVQLPENRGFAGAVNAGIRASRAEAVAVLNNDTEVSADWAMALAKTLALRPDVSFCASKVLRARQRDVIDSAGDVYWTDGYARSRGAGEVDAGQYDAATEVFGAAGSAAIYRRTLFDDVGLFDEAFFAYCEDADLSFRARLRGHRCVFVPEAVVYHVGGATVTGGVRQYLIARNTIVAILKNMPADLLVRCAPQIVLAQLKAVYFAARGRRLRLHLRALGGVVRVLPRVLVERRAIQRSRRVSTSEVAALLRRARPTGGAVVGPPRPATT